ncbi:hypothetical protein ACNTMW_14305 [Planosporangium sp. 12N6]|uniref:hypothetical protein n=1 Tax=Planosporangium spinosum TaxID=3402278 RepID=UPI003CE82CF6
MTALVTKASGSHELAVVVTSHTLRLLPAMMNELADALTEQFPPRCNRVRLVAWNSGCLHDDRPAPAYQLATRLGVEVIAPAGPLLGVPGGSLFAAAGRGAQRPGGWWRFAPGSAPSRVGWRYPAPHWDPDLGDVGELGNDLVVEQVPAGLWLHRSGYRNVTDLVYSVPVDPDNPALIVSHPDEKPLHHDDLARALAILPRRTVERLVFTPYGPEPVAEGRLGDVAASILGTPTRSRIGLPLYGSGGQRALVTIDADGRPRWRPFVRELRHDPRAVSAAAEPTDWVNPSPELLTTPAGDATFALPAGWAVETIEAGLWIRPEQLSEPADWARTLPLDVDECAVLIGTPSTGHPAPPGPAIAALLEQLPADARSRLRFAVPRGADDAVMDLATALTEQLAGTAEVRVLTPPGRRRAREASQPAAPASHALREPTPYPPQPVYRPAPTPPPPHAARQLTPPPHAARPVSPAASAATPATPYPPQPGYRPAPTPPPTHAARQLTPPTPPPTHAARQLTPPTHAARQLTPPTPPPTHALREPTPYPPQPSPYPARPADEPTRAQSPAAREPFASPMAPPARPVRQPGPPPMAPPVSPAPPPMAPPPPPMHAARQPGYSPYQPSAPHPTQAARPSGPQRGPAVPPPAHQQPTPQPPRLAHPPAPAAPPMPAASHPMPPTMRPGQPAAQQPMPPMPPVYQPTPPPMPTVASSAPEPADDSQDLLQRSEIRSHRTAGGKSGKAIREDDKATTSELNRLLGFFDEIRKARAWDEEPAGSRPGGS